MQPIHHLVPDFIYEKYRAGESYGTFQGAAMFADLSGFSTMTDALSKHGTHGAEVLANMMRVVFEPLVTAVYSQGGFVIGYAGDAFNAVFPTKQDPAETMMRCLSAALLIQMQTEMRPMASTPYGRFPIRIKVGIGYGNTRWQIFKSENGKRASYWFRGDSLNGAVLAEECAKGGEIIADAEAYKLLADRVQVTPVDDCFLIQAMDSELPPPLPISKPKPAHDLLGVFLADANVDLPVAGEFRQVLNLFIDIPPTISDEALIAPFMQTVYILQEQYGGFFLRPDMGDKGFNLLMFWGAPTAHENDVERALNFILELSTRTKITMRGGISYHMAYAGFMGAKRREDYTAYGWGVNLAARMMAHAEQGQFWLDEETAKRAEKHFNLEFLGKFHFKGFKEEQKAFSLISRKNTVEKIYQGQLVGRKKELETLASFVEPIRQGGFAGLMVLKGEAGIGKSRLTYAFQHSDFFKEIPANWVACQTDEILRLPFNPFIDWLKKRFELAEGQPDEVNMVTFSRVMQKLIDATPDPQLASELKRTTSVLAALINITEANSLYESLDAKGRYDNTLIALSILLRAESLQKPLILFIDDTHWLDKDTGAFLSYFVRTLLAEPAKQYPIAIITTQRPEGESVHMVDEISTYGIRLGRLSSGSISNLAEDILGHPVTASLLSLLDTRAEGNPFFAEQILRYLLDQNAITLDADGRCSVTKQAGSSMPTDVRAVLVARLDQLEQNVRETVQTASVLGREFVVRVLDEMLGSEKDFSHHLAQAERASIWSPLSEAEYIFKHALLRDAAYSMQLQTRQRKLHELAAHAMEKVYSSDLEPHYGELAYHAEKADLKEKALHYLTLAGKLALSVYQNQQAIEYFTRALAVVPKENLKMQCELLLLRVDGHYNLSNPAEQLKDLDSLEEAAYKLKDSGLSARVLMRRSYYFSSLGDSHNVLTYALRAKRLAEEGHDDNTILATYLVLPVSFLRIGKPEEALQFAKDGLKFAQKMKDRPREATALSTLGLVALEIETPSVAMEYQKRALDITREIKDKYLEAKVLNNLANTVGLSQGNFPVARDYFEDAYLIFQELGNIKYKGGTLMNLGWVSNMLGNYVEAMKYHEQSITFLRESQDRPLEMYAYFNLSSTANALGHAKDSLKWAHKGLDLSKQLGDRTGDGWAYFCLGYAYLLDNKLEDAIKSFLTSMQIRSETKTAVLEIESSAGLLQAFNGKGDVVAAQKEAERIIQYMDKNKSFEGAEEPLRIFLSIYQLLDQTKDLRATEVLHNATQLMNMQVSKLQTDEARRLYVENVPWRKALQYALQKQHS